MLLLVGCSDDDSCRRKLTLSETLAQGLADGTKAYFTRNGAAATAPIGSSGAVSSMESYFPYEVREYDKNGNMIGDFRDIYLIARMPDASTSKEAHVTPATGEVQYVYKDDGELVDGGKHYLT